MVLLMIVYVLEIPFAVDNKQLREIDFVKLISLLCLPFIFYLELVLTDFFLKSQVVDILGLLAIWSLLQLLIPALLVWKQL